MDKEKKGTKEVKMTNEEIKDYLKSRCVGFFIVP